MIDFWLIFNLLKPFVDIIIQTYIESLRNAEEINHHGTAISVENREENSNENRKGSMVKIIPVGDSK